MYCDVLLIGDLRVPGGTSRQAASAIQVLHGAGYSVGLIGVELPHARGPKPIDLPIRERLALGEATLIRPDDRQSIEAGLVIFDNSRAFMERPRHLGKISARSAIIAVHFPIVDGLGKKTFDPAVVEEVTQWVVDCEVKWAPISRLTRKLLQEHHPGLRFYDQIPPYVVFSEAFRSSRRKPVGTVPVIGRHSRPELGKWPDRRSDVMTAYPRGPGIEVALLGTGPYLQELVGAYPNNWRTYRFNEIDVPQFLRSIDFFVYFHHPSWIEAFGIATAEAMASGAVAILPPYMKENFGPGALYCDLEEAVPLARTLYADWESYLRQSEKGTSFVRRNHSPNRYLDVLSGLIPPRPKGRGRQPRKRKNRRYDVVVMADMSRPGPESVRIAEEIGIQVEGGIKTALIHVPDKAGGGPIRPEIDLFVKRGEVDVIDPHREKATTSLLVVHTPGAALTNLSHLMWDLRSQSTLVVISEALPNRGATLHLSRLLEKAYGGPVRFAPTSREARIYLESEAQGMFIEAEDWCPVVARIAQTPKSGPEQRPVIGLMNVHLPLRWIADADRLRRVIPSGRTFRIRFHDVGTQLKKRGNGLKLPDAWETFRPSEIAPEKFIDSLDVLAYPKPFASEQHPEMYIVKAMSRGLPVVLPPHLESHFGDGAVYAESRSTASEIRKIFNDRRLFRRISRNAINRACRFHGPEIHLERLTKLLQRPPSRKITTLQTASFRRSGNRVLMFSQNGVGLGHVVRQLAIAHHLSRSREVVFASMSQTFDVIANHGYQVEYVPSHVSTGTEYADWIPWTRDQINQIIDFYDVGAVVLDGSVPYSSLLQAVAPRPDVKLAWIRRAMWQPGPESDLRLQQERFFDIVIEPADIAESRDRGPTVAHRKVVTRVDPICLLQPKDLRTRHGAARVLGLDPERPAVLVHVGSGTNRDVISLIDRIVMACRGHSELQIVIAEWLNSLTRLDLWNDVSIVSGFPLSRIFNAFDFSIAAAGYNTFHEVTVFGLPTLYVANPQRHMDDQVARAEFAAQRGAAIASNGSMDMLEQGIQRLMQPKVRSRMRSAMRRLVRPDGARAAARAIESLFEKE